MWFVVGGIFLKTKFNLVVDTVITIYYLAMVLGFPGKKICMCILLHNIQTVKFKRNVFSIEDYIEKCIFIDIVINYCYAAINYTSSTLLLSLGSFQLNHILISLKNFVRCKSYF